MDSKYCKEKICELINSECGAKHLSIAYCGSDDIEYFIKNAYITDQNGIRVIINNISDIIKYAGNPNNWKRIAKNKESDYVVRCFDCRPFDDQLRAYVYSRNNNIYKINLEGE